MLATCGPVLLKHLQNEIEAGRYVWAMLMANEYLEPKSPIRVGLVKKVEATLPSPSITKSNSSLKAILAGKKLSELSKIEHASLNLLKPSRTLASKRRFRPNFGRSFSDRQTQLLNISRQRVPELRRSTGL